MERSSVRFEGAVRPGRARWLALAWAVLAATAAAADGLIVTGDPQHAPPGHFPFAPLEVVYHRVTVEIRDLVAETTVEQEFRNPGGRRLEGTYLFPLPGGASIDRFAMDVNGKMMEAELLPADQARALYEQIVRQARDPALLEYAGRGAIRVRIFPIEPGARKQVRIRYTQLLRDDAGVVEYVYPLNTEKFSAAPLREVSVRVAVDGTLPLKSVYCPSHDAEIRRDGERRAVVGWEERDAWPDTDFKLILSRERKAVALNLLASRRPGEDGWFLLLASAGLAAQDGGVQPKDICFVLDTSGSMAGAKLEQAKKALRFCLANLNPGDRFQLIRFSTEAEPLFPAPLPADRASLERAEAFVGGLRPIGGTAVGEALRLALAPAGTGGTSGRPYLVIFLTDGLPTVGETAEEPLVAQARRAAGAARVFPFGIGTDVNTHLLDRIAEATRGAGRYVLPDEDIEVKVSAFYTRIREPVLGDLTLDFGGPGIRVTQVLPGRLPDLFNGDMLAVFGRYSGSGPATATLRGTFAGRRREFSAEVLFPRDEPGNGFIARLWAVRRVGWLLDEIRLGGESAELREEVIGLARAFGVVTPYTAYLILEDEARRNVPASLRSFRELEQDGEAVRGAKERLDAMRREAASESSRSGKAAVDNSIAVQGMKSGLNERQAVQADGLTKAGRAAPEGYRAAQAGNYAQQVRMVNGRAFYRNGSVWTDSTAQAGGALAERRVRFGGEEYFALLKRYPQAAAWLSLGDEVDVVIDGTLIVIRQNQEEKR